MAAENAEPTEAQSQAIAEKVREELARRRISRQRLADDAKISISTLEKALNGSRPFTLATLVRLEQVLGTALRPKKDSRAEKLTSAPADLGGYTRAAVKMMEGDYLTLRPSFGAADAIYAYRTNIYWDEAADHLAFREAERMDSDFAQEGVVSAPVSSGHIYFYTNYQGQMRLAILGRPLKTGEMYGLLTTLLSGSGPQLLPLATPLALIPLGKEPAFGRITVKHPRYAEYHRQLSRVTASDFVRFPKISS